MKTLVFALALLLCHSVAFAQTRNYPLISNFSGAKFAARYNLDPKRDFWVLGTRLYLRDGAVVADNPPIQETSDPAYMNQRTKAKAAIDAQTEMILRAIVAALLDEINKLRASTVHPIVSLTRTGNVVTATTPVAHGLSVAETVSVFGADQGGYSGTHIVTDVPSPTQFSYTIGGTPASPATGTLIYVEGSIPGPTPQATLQQAINAIKAKIDSGDAD